MFDPESLKLIAITDELRDDRHALIARTAAAVRGGATMIQLRLKDENPRTIVEVAIALLATIPRSVPLLINDRLDVALAAGAAGVHLGADDLPVAAARRIAPTGFVIGASVGCDAEVPGSRGADYVGIGPLFDTSSKADAGAAIGAAEFARLAALCALPAVAIGGIDASNARAAIDAGARGVASINAIFGTREPEAAARALRRAIG
ncbi:MAG TPA: thiamine phosphate synthase [Gemmatimonadaceae bacterium]|nr:thiamine phosphate synthase [Gemmatimonadaceae bacterium]HEU6452186.1 thiamine phosphate synthase [Gemmatimonadaceae bacterium]